ncbi:MAG TPA: hypothetical protein VFR67_06215 [Pilimelia sp.]|nr:hypothetical protein [Pilimelia sp.]
MEGQTPPDRPASDPGSATASEPGSATASGRAVPGSRSGSSGTLLALAREVVAFAAVIGSLSLVMRALIVAHFDLSVTGALAANASATVFVTSTLVQVTPLVLYAGAVAAAYHAGAGAQAGRRRPYLVVLSLLLACPLLGTSEVLYALVVLAGLPAAFLVGRDRGRRGLLIRLAGWVAIAVLLFNFLPVRMWLPPERAEVSGSTQTIYVLRDDGEDLVIFDPRSVSVLRVPGTQVSNRQFCQSGDRRTIGELLLGPAERQIPQCP